MADADWRPVDPEAFQENDQNDISITTVTVVPADSDLAAELLLNPLEHLTKNIGWVTDEWTVSLERVNAEEPVIPARRGPRKLIAIWVAILPLQRVCGVVYRVPA